MFNFLGRHKQTNSLDNIKTNIQKKPKKFKNLDEEYSYKVAVFYTRIYQSVHDAIVLDRRNKSEEKFLQDAKGTPETIERLRKGSETIFAITADSAKINDRMLAENFMSLFVLLHYHNWTYQTHKHEKDTYEFYQKCIDRYGVEDIWTDCTAVIKMNSKDIDDTKLMAENAKPFLESMDDLDMRMMFHYNYDEFIQGYMDILHGLYAKYDLPDNLELKTMRKDEKLKALFDSAFSTPIYDEDGNQVN